MKGLIPMTDKKTLAQIFAKNLKRIRLEKNISRKELAVAVGVSEMAVGFYENEKKLPTIENAFLIASALDVSITDLFGDTPNAENKKIFDYRLQRAIDTAKSLRCEISFLSDGKISVTLPPSISVENGNLLGRKVEVNYDISFAPITFDNSKVFVSVMEELEKSALFENNFFLNKFQDTFFKTKRRITSKSKTA